MNRIALLRLTLTAFSAAPALAQLESLLGGTVAYNGEVLSSPKQHLAFGSFLPGATISVPLSNLTQRAQIGVAYNARSIATVSMANNGRLTQVDPVADGNPDGRRTHRWILVGGSIAGSQTATQPAGRYEGTITVTIRRHNT